MGQIRKPFQGIMNIVRFNWHFYVLSFGFSILILYLANYLPTFFSFYLSIVFLLIIATTFISLITSFYIYDLSGLYKLDWLNDFRIEESSKIVTIHAGFDETSALLKAKFKNSELAVLDFYDPVKHTEVSIKRARKSYPSFPGTLSVSTRNLPIEDKSIQNIFVILSAHEIRDLEERIAFFKELGRILEPAGQILITEHLRDKVNFLAYTIGFFHFYSKSSWLKTFQSAELTVVKEMKITPFISTFILEKNGTSF